MTTRADPFNQTSLLKKPRYSTVTITIVAGATVSVTADMIEDNNNVKLTIPQLQGLFTSSPDSNVFIPQRLRPSAIRSFAVPGILGGTKVNINLHVQPNGTIKLQSVADANFSLSTNGTNGTVDISYCL